MNLSLLYFFAPAIMNHLPVNGDLTDFMLVCAYFRLYCAHNYGPILLIFSVGLENG